MVQSGDSHCSLNFLLYLGANRLVNFRFCSCHSEVQTLTKLGFFPSSPNRPTVAFQFQLLDILESLLLECQVPVKDFLAALACYSPVPFLQVYLLIYI